jgi:hypothetical protein
VDRGVVGVTNLVFSQKRILILIILILTPHQVVSWFHKNNDTDQIRVVSCKVSYYRAT